MLIAVVIMFSINFFPVHFLPVLQFIVDKTVHEESDAKENWTLFFQTSAIITHCLCYFNSAINPIIYYFMSAQFKVKPFCLKTGCLKITENSLIQHCERSKLRLHFEWTKVNGKCQDSKIQMRHFEEFSNTVRLSMFKRYF